MQLCLLKAILLQLKAASLLGLCSPEVRLPLVQVEEESKRISEALKVAKYFNDENNNWSKIICLNRKASFNYFHRKIKLEFP